MTPCCWFSIYHRIRPHIPDNSICSDFPLNAITRLILVTVKHCVCCRTLVGLPDFAAEKWHSCHLWVRYPQIIFLINTLDLIDAEAFIWQSGLCNKTVAWTIYGKAAWYNVHCVSNIYSKSFRCRFTLKIEWVFTFVTFVLSTKQYGVMSQKKSDIKLTAARKWGYWPFVKD